MKCPRCQFENKDSAKFCNECGRSLTPTTGTTPQAFSFDEKLERIQRYLPNGLTDRILAQRDKIEGERKQVTVMFCDMEGFTLLVERLGPEGAYRVMDQVYEILIHKVHDFEGTVNEMTGDGIMALFGAPIALEDAPQKALRSALSIHSEIARFSDQQKGIGSIKMRVGIHTGPVVVGTLGNDLRVGFKAVGDTVNLASRMEGLAESGTTYVTEETFRLTEGLFRFEALGKKAVKGKREGVPVYKVLSGKEDVYRPRLGSERMIYSEMVGRDHELDRLELQVMKAINGEGSIVNIIGEAGIGKSRLVAELKKREVTKRVTLLEGRAISMGRNLGFHPIIDLLKQWAQIREDDGEAAAFGKLQAAVRSLFPEAVGEILPFLATLMGMKLSGGYAERIEGIEGEALEKLILKNVRELLTRATELTPLVIITEDLHWADTSSIEFMESLFRLAETQRILFVNLFRPGHKETGDRIIETIRERLPVYYVELVLEPLDERMSEALITNMLNIGGLHRAITEQIAKRAGGNPFFIEEVVRSLIDEGALVLKDGTFQVTEKIRTVAIPNTINDVLMARIDRLEQKTRDLVKVASVIGRSFFRRILSEVAGTVEGVEGRLSYLQEIQLVRERTRMGEVEYLFNNALAQEAVYQSILAQKRKELHLRVAGSIERVFRGRLHEFHGVLAYHYSRAESLEKAEEYLIKAGEEALRSSASNEALHYYQEALGLYLKKYANKADPEKVAMLEKSIALALYNRGQYVEAVRYFDRALDYYWGGLPKNTISAIPKFLSACLHLLTTIYIPSLKFRQTPTERDSEAVDLFYKKCKALAIINPKRFFPQFLYLYKRVTSFDLTGFDLGLEIFMGASALFILSGISFRFGRKILDAARERINKSHVRIVINYDLLETIHNYLAGNWTSIRACDDDLVKRTLSVGGIYDASQYLYWHGVSSIYRGFLENAKSIVNRLEDIVESYENDFSLVLKYELKINLLIESRNVKEALRELGQAIEFTQKTGFHIYLFDMYSYELWIHTLMEDMEKAETSLKRADEIRQKVHAVPVELCAFYRSRLEFYFYRLRESIEIGNRSNAIEYRKKFVNSAKTLVRVSKKTSQYRTESYRLKGLYHWLLEDQKKALELWHRGIKEGERLGARLELSRAYCEVGKHLLQNTSRYETLNGIKAEGYLEKGRALFEEMDLQWDLDEVSRVASG